MASEMYSNDSNRDIEGVLGFNLEQFIDRDPILVLKEIAVAAQEYISRLIKDGVESEDIKQTVERVTQELDLLADRCGLMGEQAVLSGYDVFFPYTGYDDAGNIVLGAQKVDEAESRFFDEIETIGSFSGFHFIIQTGSSTDEGALAVEIPLDVTLCFQIAVNYTAVPHTTGTRFAFGSVCSTKLRFISEERAAIAMRLFRSLSPYESSNIKITQELAYIESLIDGIGGFDNKDLEKIREVGRALEILADERSGSLPILLQDSIADLIRVKLLSFAEEYVCVAPKIILKGGIANDIRIDISTMMERVDDPYKLRSALVDVVWTKSGDRILPTLVFEASFSIDSGESISSTGKRVICVPLSNIANLLPVS